MRDGARARDNARMRWIAIAIALGCFAACDGDPQAQARGVCTVVCRCEAPPVSAIQDECVEDCVGDLGGFALPQACTDCVFQNADRCNTLEGCATSRAA